VIPCEDGTLSVLIAECRQKVDDLEVVFFVSGPGETASSDGVHNASSPKRKSQFVQFNSEQGAAILVPNPEHRQY